MAATFPITYLIAIGSATQLAALQAKYPNGVQMPPDTAAVTFGAPVLTPAQYQNGKFPPAPFILLDSPYPNNPFQEVGGPPVVLATNVESVPYPAYPTNPLPTFPQFPGFTLFWNGDFVLWAAAPPVAPPPTQPIGVRRFLMGFEAPDNGEGLTSTSKRFSRDSSRTPEGIGWAYRSEGATQGPVWNFSPTVASGYERFYVRLRTLPVGGNDMIWFLSGSIEGAGPTLHVDVNPAGQLLFYNQGNGGAPGTLLFTSAPLGLGTWYKIDVNYAYSTGALVNGSLQVWINCATQGSFAVAHGGAGLGLTGQLANSTHLGTNAGGSHGLECDFDDWLGSDFLDVTTGSHIYAVHPTGFDPISQAAWVGDWRQLLPIPADLAASTDAVVTSTGSAILAVTTDFGKLIPQIGCAAFLVTFRNNGASAVTCKLGYKINGGASVLQNVSVTNNVWNQSLYTVPGTTIPTINSLSLVFQKDAAGSTLNAGGLQASAEILGIFGPEDVLQPSAAIVPVPSHVGIHNAPYPTTAFSRGAAVLTDVQIWSGVYNGNNLGQDVISQIPAHWWWVRPLSADTAGVYWFSSMVGSHGRLAEQIFPIRMARAQLNNSLQGSMSVAGQDNQGNATGVQYQWIAVSDPGMRFIINGALGHNTGLVSANDVLINPAFTPECLFLVIEQPSGGTTGSFFKSLGHPLNQASPLDAAVNNNVVAINPGSLTTLPAAWGTNANTQQTAYSAWRRTDGSAGGCGVTPPGLFDLVTYVGNGASPRNIAVQLNGRSPLFAIGTPHNATSIFRDASHAGVNSSVMGGGNTTTGFTGGDINTVVVGSSLNANGVTYDIFVIGGQATPGFWSPNLPTPIQVACPTGGAPPFAPIPPLNPTPVPPPTPVPTPIPPRGACYPFSLLKSDLANRLQDPGKVHWTDVELGRYIVEALRTFNAFTHNYRQQGAFSSTVFAPFYDLPTMLPALRGYNVTDASLITDIQYSLMEPPTPTVWTGTSQFTLQDVLSAVQRRLDLFLQETGAVITRQIQAITVAANGRVVLPQNYVTLRRAAWIMNDTVFTAVPLKREDEWGAGHYQRRWTQQQGVPSLTWPTGYSEGVTPPKTVQMIPPPASNGWLDTLGIVLGNLLNPAGPVLLGVPDDWTWVVKFGALCDLLSRDGTAYDSQRAAYCQARWEHGIGLATQASVLLNAQVNGGIVPVAALQEADLYARNWQYASGQPSKVMTIGQNLFSPYFPADAKGPYTFTLDVVANIPIPVADTDCVNVGVGDEDLDTILDYAEHLALFKEGPEQVSLSMSLYDSFAKSCGVTEALNQALVPNRGAILQQTVQDPRVVPRESPPEKTTS